MALPHDHGTSMEKLLHHAPAPEEFQLLAEIFRQLSDGTRVRIFWILSHGEVCVANLSALMGMSSPAVSHHLRLLKEAGLEGHKHFSVSHGILPYSQRCTAVQPAP